MTCKYNVIMPSNKHYLSFFAIDGPWDFLNAVSISFDLLPPDQLLSPAFFNPNAATWDRLTLTQSSDGDDDTIGNTCIDRNSNDRLVFGDREPFGSSSPDYLLGNASEISSWTYNRVSRVATICEADGFGSSKSWNSCTISRSAKHDIPNSSTCLGISYYS